METYAEALRDLAEMLDGEFQKNRKPVAEQLRSIACHLVDPYENHEPGAKRPEFQPIVERYQNDATFCRLVDTMTSWMLERDLSPSDLQGALDLALLQVLAQKEKDGQ